MPAFLRFSSGNTNSTLLSLLVTSSTSVYSISNFSANFSFWTGSYDAVQSVDFSPRNLLTKIGGCLLLVTIE